MLKFLVHSKFFGCKTVTLSIGDTELEQWLQTYTVIWINDMELWITAFSAEYPDVVLPALPNINTGE